jgi:hypothetical protein
MTARLFQGPFHRRFAFPAWRGAKAAATGRHWHEWPRGKTLTQDQVWRQIGNERAIRFVDRRGEKGANQDLGIAMRVHPRFADESNGFTQTLDGCCNEEIAAQLDEIGIGRLVAGNEGLLSHRVKQWAGIFRSLAWDQPPL